MWGHMNDYSWGGMGVGMLVFWVVFIAGIALLARVACGPRTEPPRSREQSALDILNERYARGEIDREEYEQKKHDLEE